MCQTHSRHRSQSLICFSEIEKRDYVFQPQPPTTISDTAPSAINPTPPSPGLPTIFLLSISPLSPTPPSSGPPTIFLLSVRSARHHHLRHCPPSSSSPFFAKLDATTACTASLRRPLHRFFSAILLRFEPFLICSVDMEGMMMMIPLKDIAPAAQNNINTQFIVLDKGRVTFEGQQKTCLALVADNTAAVHFQLWADECDAFEPGDIVRLANGIFSYQRNNLVLRAGKRGKVQKVGEFTMAFVETPNMSEIRWVPDPNNSKKYVQEAVLSPHSRIFPPML